MIAVDMDHYSEAALLPLRATAGHFMHLGGWGWMWGEEVPYTGGVRKLGACYSVFLYRVRTLYCTGRCSCWHNSSRFCTRRVAAACRASPAPMLQPSQGAAAPF
jgi:hypothetical protein